MTETLAASCPLPNNLGTLAIPVRGDYEAALSRGPDRWELRLGRNGTSLRTDLLLVPAGIDLDTHETHDAYFHAEIRIEGYRYGIRIERREGVLTLLLLDGLVQPRHVTQAELDAYAASRNADVST